MASKKYVKQFFKVIYLHSVQRPFCWGLSLLPNFQKKRPDRISNFRGRSPKNRGDIFQQRGGGGGAGGEEVLQLLHKK